MASLNTSELNLEPIATGFKGEFAKIESLLAEMQAEAEADIERALSGQEETMIRLAPKLPGDLVQSVASRLRKLADDMLDAWQADREKTIRGGAENAN